MSNLTWADLWRETWPLEDEARTLQVIAEIVGGLPTDDEMRQAVLALARDSESKFVRPATVARRILAHRKQAGGEHYATEAPSCPYCNHGWIPEWRERPPTARMLDLMWARELAIPCTCPAGDAAMNLPSMRSLSYNGRKDLRNRSIQAIRRLRALGWKRRYDREECTVPIEKTVAEFRRLSGTKTELDATDETRIMVQQRQGSVHG